ncbi:efflux RND transporter periplasmic adaptor subunit [Dasania marina]|uniref:efflux RND transporter periplasmic adaptor subunit n=1 Tax=Dasania marina TaxID=471499 RepID=UPI0030DA0361|tara:strand:+ start:44703 stop:45950 length:1248 start_codon:yes stop_codon:yes gene_type:complete
MLTPHSLRYLLFAAMAALAACQSSDERQAAGQPNKTGPEVSVAEVINVRITEWDEFTGRLEAPQTVALRPRVSGYIDEVVFKEGALVTEGDVLFLIDDKALQAQFKRLQADVAHAESELFLAQRELERAQRLKKQNAIAQEALDNRLAHKQQAAATLHAKQASLAEMQLDLDYTQVKAPISGRVSRALITKGNYVAAGQSMLTTVVSTEKIYAYFDADEQTYLKYSQLARDGSRPSSRDNQSPVFMGLVSDEGYPHAGHMDFVDNQINQQTGTIRGRAVFENEDGRFTPGLFARIKVAGSASYEGILIDDKAVATDLSHKFVWVVDDNNQVERRAVVLGETHNGLRIIEQGLAAHERIIVNGVQRVRSGVTVQPQPVEMADKQLLAQLQQLQQRVDELQAQTAIALSKLPSDQRS